MILNLVERMLPGPFPFPGAKLGLANLVTVVALVLYGLAGSLLVAVFRTTLGSILVGSFLSFGFLLSFTAAVLSTMTMALIYRLFCPRVFSLVGVSICGAVVHNLVQLLIAFVIIGHSEIFVYTPYLILSAIPTGFFVGLISFYVINRLWSLLEIV